MPSETTTVRAADGTALLQRTWPVTRPVGGVFLLHGLGEHTGRYEHVAAVFTELGLVVRGFDQRGFGESEGKRATIPRDDALLDDARQQFDAFAAELRAGGVARAPFLLGHSMGGGLAARAVTGGWIAPRGLVLSSPALVPRITWIERVAARIGRVIAPNLRLPHRLPMHKLSHDPAVLAAATADTRMHILVTPRLVAFMLDAGARALADAARCGVPTLLLVAGDDHFVRADASRRFAAALPEATLEFYEPLYHEVFNELAANRAEVLADLRAWTRRELERES